MGNILTQDLPINGLKKLIRRSHEDERGSLSRMFCDEELFDAGWQKDIKQINQTFTKKNGSLRGMHYQLPPYAEAKIVNCVRGEIFDVAVDLRQGSPTFLKWHAEILSAKNRVSLLIPEGFAHGFQTLVDDCELIYFHSQYYSPEHEMGMFYGDPKLSIDWPKEISEISERDASHNNLTDQFNGLYLK
jgi:dTDP-4-dehydrorhamnose 3,5-epimerase